MTGQPATWPIEVAGPLDTPDLAALLAASMRGPWTEDMVRESLEAGSLAFVIRDPAAGPAGLLAALGMLRVAGEESEIMQLAVSPACRNRGLGSRMLLHLISVSARAGVRDVYLEVRAGNHAARALYVRAGFEDLGLRARYYADGEDARVMRLHLEFPLRFV